MANVEVMVDGSGAFNEDAARGLLRHTDQTIKIAGSAKGMLNPFPIVAIGVYNAVGECLLAQTSLEAFLNAADMLRERYGDPRRRIF